MKFLIILSLVLLPIASFGQQLVAVSGGDLPVVPLNGVVQNKAVTTGGSTFTAPFGAIGFLLGVEATNTSTVRWAIGTTASTTVGVLMAAGTNTGFIPGASTISVAPSSGTQNVSVQWMTRH